MFRNYLATALRNVVRNRLYAGINIVGVTLGFVALLLIALFVRDELTFDRFIPGHGDVYRLSKTMHINGAVISTDGSGPIEAEWVKNDIPEVQSAARLWPQYLGIRRGEVESVELVIWTDASVFDVFPFPVLAGDVSEFARPDTVVITKRTAEKYFGRTDVVGEMLEVDRKAPLQIVAVMETIPSRSHLNVDILAAGNSKIAPFATSTRTTFSVAPVYTYLRVKPQARAAVERALPLMLDRHVPTPLALSTAEA